MTNKDKFLRYADWRRKLKVYEKRALEADLTSVTIKAMERTSGRKIGQVTRR